MEPRSRKIASGERRDKCGAARRIITHSESLKMYSQPASIVQPYHLPSAMPTVQQPQQYAQMQQQPAQQGMAAARTAMSVSSYQPPTGQAAQHQTQPTAAKTYDSAKRAKYTKEQVEQMLDEVNHKTAITDAFQVLVRNLRVLEILQRRIFNDPTAAARLQETKSAYFNTILQQMQAQNLSIQQLRARIMSLDLQNQLSAALDYLHQNSTKLTEYTKKSQRLTIDCKQLMDAITASAVSNFDLKVALEDIISRFDELQGKEGCIPQNWSGLRLFRELLAEVSQKFTNDGPQIIESWEHWADKLNNLYCTQIYPQQWE